MTRPVSLQVPPALTWNSWGHVGTLDLDHFPISSSCTITGTITGNGKGTSPSRLLLTSLSGYSPWLRTEIWLLILQLYSSSCSWTVVRQLFRVTSDPYPLKWWVLRWLWHISLLSFYSENICRNLAIGSSPFSCYCTGEQF